MITIATSSLKPALAGLAKVVTNKCPLEVLRCVRVEARHGWVAITATDLDLFAKVELLDASCEETASFLVPLERLQAAVRKTAPAIKLEPGRISCDLGTGRVTESFEAPSLDEFPTEPDFQGKVVPMPETFGVRFMEALRCASIDPARYVINGVCLDSSERGSHYLVGTDGRHLFSANSFDLPNADPAILPNHKVFGLRGLSELPWAVGFSEVGGNGYGRIVAGNWSITLKTVEGNFPAWRQVIPGESSTHVNLAGCDELRSILLGLPGGELADKPIDIIVAGSRLRLADPSRQSEIDLPDARVTGPDVTVRINRDYLAKALAFGLTEMGLTDGCSPLRFTADGRQMIVMPMRVATYDNPAPPEPQPERNIMPATNGHTNNGEQPAAESERPAPDKPAIESAIEKMDGFKATLREALTGFTEITALLRQAIRDQKAGDKEVQSVRQTLRSLQSVKI